MKNQKKKIIKLLLTIIGFGILIFTAFALLDKKTTYADSGFSTSYDGGSKSGYSGESNYREYYRIYESNRKQNNKNNNREIGLGEAMIMLSIALGILGFVAYWFIRASWEDKQKIKEKDKLAESNTLKAIPRFNKKQFLKDGYKIYCDVQDAWMNFKLEKVRNVITDELYAMYESQLSTLKAKGQQNIMKNFSLKQSDLKDVTIQNDTVTIEARYVIKFYDYIIDTATGKVVRGTKHDRMKVTYLMKFRKNINETQQVTKCPNCGAELHINGSGTCKYCHTKVVKNNSDWVLTEKKVIDQEYV